MPTEPSKPVPELTDAEPDGTPEPAHESNPWRDSSLDLERGLDVVELPVDLVLPDAPGRKS